MRFKPRAFISSSKEALWVAKAIQQNLRETVETKNWTQNAFELSHNTIDELSKNLQRSDFGIFVFAGSDVSIVRREKKKSVRDNVVLELGISIGLLGKERSFIVQPEESNMHLISNLAGVIPAEYDEEWAKDEPIAALGPACSQIEDAIRHQHHKKNAELFELMREALETICRFMTAPVTPENAGLRAFIFRCEPAPMKSTSTGSVKEQRLVCRYFWDPHDCIEVVGDTWLRINRRTAAKGVVVRCYLNNQNRKTNKTERSSVARVSETFDGLEGSVNPDLKYILAVPIRNRDGSIWGVVDFDASDDDGIKILKSEKTSDAAILRLSRHLAKILAH